jgi:16S rRNA (uracil1498-N3)-methyltransferase
MPAERYFFPQPFSLGIPLILQDQEFHHLTNVMRAREGEEIEVVNGLGQLAKGIIQSIEKKRAVVVINEVQNTPQPTNRLILAQAIPRLNRLEYILEKGTELGVTEFLLFPSTHSERKEFSENQTERLNTILIAATKQCGRLFLPALNLMPPLKKWSSIPLPAFFGDTRSQAKPLYQACSAKPALQAAVIFIGPESGFTSEEVRWFEQHGVEGIKLHSNILRTDTAAITALSLLSHWMFLP